MPDIVEQYRIIKAGAGWRRQTERGRLRFTGADRASFLQALVTNEVQAVPEGQGAYAAYLTPNGRMITDLHIYVRPDYILADVPGGLAANLASKFDQLIFSEDVIVTDVSAGLAQIEVVGGQAHLALAAVTGLNADAILALPVHGSLENGGVLVARTDAAGEAPAFAVFIPAAGEEALVARLADAGALAMESELSEAMRVNAGRPQFGVDMNENTIPLEAGLLERAISTTKGCYVGQEIVIRVLHRGGGRVAKRLMKLRGDTPAPPVRGERVLNADDAEVGQVTSAAPALDAGGWVALAYLNRDAAESLSSVIVAGASANVAGPVS